MRHKFSREETLKGVRNAVSKRAAELKLKKKELKQASQEMIMNTLTKVTEPERIPYLAAFLYGTIATARIVDVLKTKDPTKLTPSELLWMTLGSVEGGLVAVIAYGMATTKNQASVAGNATQILGAAILGGMGLAALASPALANVTTEFPTPEAFKEWWDKNYGGSLEGLIAGK